MWQFAQVSGDVGLNLDDGESDDGANWGDIDNDGYGDVFVTDPLHDGKPAEPAWARTCTHWSSWPPKLRITKLVLLFRSETTG